jgi:hypothetical protein
MAADVLSTRYQVETDDLYPKHLNRFLGQAFDYVITVRDRTEETCPTFPGGPGADSLELRGSCCLLK